MPQFAEQPLQTPDLRPLEAAESRGDAAKASQGAGCSGGPAALVLLPPGNWFLFAVQVLVSHLIWAFLLQKQPGPPEMFLFSLWCSCMSWAEPCCLLGTWLLCRSSKKREILSLGGAEGQGLLPSLCSSQWQSCPPCCSPALHFHCLHCKRVQKGPGEGN